MRVLGCRKWVATVVAAVVALVVAVPVLALVTEAPASADSQSIVVEVPRRSASPSAPVSPSASATPDRGTTPAPGDERAGGELPPTGGEGLVALVIGGAAIVGLGLLARRIARRRQSSTAPRS